MIFFTFSSVNFRSELAAAIRVEGMKPRWCLYYVDWLEKWVNMLRHMAETCSCGLYQLLPLLCTAVEEACIDLQHNMEA